MPERSLESMVDHLHRVAAERDDSVSDGVLLTRFVQFHDPAAFELIVWRHGAMVQAVCRRVLGRNGDIDDAFQATFLVLLRHARSIRRHDSLAAWLHGVALRVARRYLRTLAAQQRLERRVSEPEVQHPADFDSSDIGPILHAEIELLPERLRKPFVLCEIEGRTDAETAAILAIPYGTVISRLSRARERLRRRLVKRGVVLGSTGLAAILAERPASAALVASAMHQVLQTDSGTTAAATLAKGVIHTMFIRKAKMTVAASLAALIVVGVGLTTISRQLSSVQAGDETTRVPDEPGKNKTKKPQDVDETPAKAPEVTVALPTVRTVTDYQDFNGHLQAVSTVTIRPRVTGLLSKVSFQDGADVQQGQVLFEIDSLKYRTELEKARSALMAAEAKLALAESNLKRMQALRENKAVDNNTLDQAVAERATAQADVQRVKTDVELAHRNLALTQITAPIAGQLGRHLVDIGNLVKADETALAEIVNTSRMYVYCDVAEQSLIQIRSLMAENSRGAKGLEVGVALSGETGFPHPGMIDFVDNKVNPASGTALVRVMVANKDGKILPGMSARVRLFMGRPHEAKLMPRGASLHGVGGNRYSVYVVGENNTVEQRTVELGRRYDDDLSIASGLSTEDRVVVGSRDKIKPGMIVKPLSAAKPTHDSDQPNDK